MHVNGQVCHPDCNIRTRQGIHCIQKFVGRDIWFRWGVLWCMSGRPTSWKICRQQLGGRMCSHHMFQWPCCVWHLGIQNCLSRQAWNQSPYRSAHQCHSLFGQSGGQLVSGCVLVPSTQCVGMDESNVLGRLSARVARAVSWSLPQCPSCAAHSSDSSWWALLVGWNETRERTGVTVLGLWTVGSATIPVCDEGEAVSMGGSGMSWTMLVGMLSILSSLGNKTVAGSDRSCISSASFRIQII